jgi:hypothetical protein
MHALFEIVTQVLAALVAVAFAQFGVALKGETHQHASPPEVRRTVNPDSRPTKASLHQPSPVTLQRTGRRA